MNKEVNADKNDNSIEVGKTYWKLDKITGTLHLRGVPKKGV